MKNCAYRLTVSMSDEFRQWVCEVSKTTEKLNYLLDHRPNMGVTEVTEEEDG